MSSWALLAPFAALAAAGAWFDVRQRTIPNALNLTMAVLGLVAMGIEGGTTGVLSALAHFAVALALALLAYGFKLWGGGDAKFYAASAAWFTLGEAPRLITAVSLAGLVLVAGWLALGRLRRGKREGRHAQLPYGLAIAAGGILTMGVSVLRG